MTDTTSAPTSAPASSTTTHLPATIRRFPLLRTGLVAGAVAAVATTALAAGARAIDIPVAVGGEEIPLLGFAQMTLVGALLGVAIARVCANRTHRPRSLFVAVTVALTALSLLPDLLADATTATRGLLTVTHVVAAAIVIPSLGRRLSTVR